MATLSRYLTLGDFLYVIASAFGITLILISYVLLCWYLSDHRKQWHINVSGLEIMAGNRVLYKYAWTDISRITERNHGVSITPKDGSRSQELGFVPTKMIEILDYQWKQGIGYDVLKQ
jgi:hypothetical protein